MNILGRKYCNYTDKLKQQNETNHKLQWDIHQFWFPFGVYPNIFFGYQKMGHEKRNHSKTVFLFVPIFTITSSEIYFRGLKVSL